MAFLRSASACSSAASSLRREARAASVGHGASFEGLAALLTMLSSCAPGVCVVNIDGGFSGAQVAYRIVRRASRAAVEGAS